MGSKPTVGVIGVGAMGSMAMWRLAEAGFDVTGIERYGVPHDMGAHGAETRIYRQAYREGADYLPLLTRSHELWKDLIRFSGREVFQQNGCLYISDGATPWLEETAEAATAYKVPVTLLSDSELATNHPQHRLYGGEVGLLDHNGGTLRPEQAVLAATGAALRLGATLMEYTVVTDVAPDSAGVTVVTDTAGPLRFDAVFIASGAWTSPFQKDLGFEIVAQRLPGTWFPVDVPADFVPDRFPVSIRVAGDLDYSGFPCVDGWTVKVMPPVFPDTQTIAESVDRTVSPKDTAYTRRVVAELLNGVSGSPARTGVYIDGFTADHRPVIDYSLGSNRVVGAVGFSGHGFKMSPAVGEIAVDLIEATIGARSGIDRTRVPGGPFLRHSEGSSK
jgi:sarcosine oxidase